MGDVKSIFLAEKDCKTKTEANLRILLEYDYELLINHLEISKKYSSIRPNYINERPIAIFFINDRIFKCLYCALDMLIRGHYNENLSLQRDAFELIKLTEYFLKEPEKSKEWLEGKKFPFKETNKKEYSPFPFDGEIYGVLCDFTHPNHRSTIRESGAISPEIGEPFSFKPFFQRELARDSLTSHIVLLIRGTKNFLEFIEKYHTSIDKDDFEMVTTLDQRLPSILEFLKNETE